MALPTFAAEHWRMHHTDSCRLISPACMKPTSRHCCCRSIVHRGGLTPNCYKDAAVHTMQAEAITMYILIYEVQYGQLINSVV